MRIVNPRHGDAISGVVPVLVRVSHPQALPDTAVVLVQVKSSAGYWVNKAMCLVLVLTTHAALATGPRGGHAA